MLHKIDPVTLAVNESEECVAFYKDKLGLIETHEEVPQDQFIIFNIGGSEFSIQGGYEWKMDGLIYIPSMTVNTDE